MLLSLTIDKDKKEDTFISLSYLKYAIILIDLRMKYPIPYATINGTISTIRNCVAIVSLIRHLNPHVLFSYIFEVY